MKKSFDPNHPLPDAYWVIPDRLMAGPYPAPQKEHTVRERILRILGAGVTLFLDLTEPGEMPPYTHHLDDMAQHLRFPIPDFGVPSVEQMVQTLDAIDVALGTGHTVYVHCRAGLGRTGTVVGCFMVRHGMTGAEALQTIRVLRRDTWSAGSASPETDLQRSLVLNWERQR